MRRRLFLSTATVAVLLALGIGITSLPPASPKSALIKTASSERRFHVSLRESIPDTFDDGGKKGPSSGDSFLTWGPLLNGRGQQVGRILAEAQVFRFRVREQHWGSLSATFIFFGKGTITVEGPYQFESVDDNLGTQAVSGGTGRFFGARGSVRTVSSPRGVIAYYFRLLK